MQLLWPHPDGEMQAAEIPGYALKVLADGQMDWQDTSGETSAAARVFKGWRPWRVSLALGIPREDPAAVGALRSLYNALDEAGQPRIYQVADCPTCAALGIRLARFVDTLRIEEEDQARSWRVSCVLEAVDELPERREQGSTAAGETATQAPAQKPQAIDPLRQEAQEAAAEGNPSALMSVLETVLKMLDDLAGKHLYGAEEQPLQTPTTKGGTDAPR